MTAEDYAALTAEIELPEGEGRPATAGRNKTVL